MVYTETDGDGQTIQSETHYPYHIAAEEIARKQRRAHDSKYGGGSDEHDEDPADVSPFVSTIAVNYRHLQDFDSDLADAVEGEAVRFEPYLRRAAREFVLARHPELDSDGNGGASSDDRSRITTYFVAIHNMREVLPVRSLRTGTIGRLSSISGTVTRTSDVRPELLVGSFRCGKCGLVAPDVEQQYHLTRPTLCRNPRCQNRNPQEFTLEADGSEYVDWQRLRVQENADEIPPGSMPRTVDAVVRNEMVERAKAGDRVVLTGSLVVVPDGSALARAGEAARAGGGNPGARAGREAASGGGGGVRGLAALGVRELTYRTCFVAGCVMPSDVANRVRVRGNALAENEGYVHESWLFGIGNENDESPKTAQEVAMEFTEEEKAEIRRMKDMPNLYEEVSLKEWEMSAEYVMRRIESGRDMPRRLLCQKDQHYIPTSTTTTDLSLSSARKVNRPDNIRPHRGQEGHPPNAPWRGSQNDVRGHPPPRRHQPLHRGRSVHGQVAVPQVRPRLPP